MAEFLLAGVHHSIGNNLEAQALMTPDQTDRFKELVVPRLTNRSIIFSEGLYRTGLIEPGMPNYQGCLTGGMKRVLGDLRPAFGFFDPRAQHGNQRRHIHAVREWTRSNERTFTLRDVPQDLESAVAKIRAGNHAYERTGNLTPVELENARIVAQANRKFNRNYIDAMKRYGARCDLCVLVAGWAHSMSISVHTGWPFITLCAPERATDLYIGYVGMQILPQIAITTR